MANSKIAAGVPAEAAQDKRRGAAVIGKACVLGDRTQDVGTSPEFG